MTPKNFRHRVERTRNKHSRAVCQGDTIIIRLARNLSKTEEKDHIRNLLRRMTHLLLEEHQKTPIDPFKHLLNGGQTQCITLSSRKQYRFTLEPAATSRALETADGWTIRISPQIRRKALHRILWNAISKSELRRVTELVHRINAERFGVRISTVKLQFASTQWGSCSPKGVIMLNTALLFLPPSILTYVIVHELAHRRHSNHSPAYWREVERAMPGYKKPYQALKEYRLPSY